MDYLARAEVDETIWAKVATARKVSCCGCRTRNTWAWAAIIVPDRFRYSAEHDLRLKSCDDGAHSQCVLCATCGKKLGFEW